MGFSSSEDDGSGPNGDAPIAIDEVSNFGIHPKLLANLVANIIRESVTSDYSREAEHGNDVNDQSDNVIVAVAQGQPPLCVEHSMSCPYRSKRHGTRLETQAPLLNSRHTQTGFLLKCLRSFPSVDQESCLKEVVTYLSFDIDL